MAARAAAGSSYARCPCPLDAPGTRTRASRARQPGAPGAGLPGPYHSRSFRSKRRIPRRQCMRGAAAGARRGARVPSQLPCTSRAPARYPCGQIARSRIAPPPGPGPGLSRAAFASQPNSQSLEGLGHGDTSRPTTAHQEPYNPTTLVMSMGFPFKQALNKGIPLKPYFSQRLSTPFCFKWLTPIHSSSFQSLKST
jgi:hypothetical protein